MVTTSTTIRVRHQSVYGKDLIYVADAVQARALTILTNKKTLDDLDLLALVDLGFTVEWVTS